MYTEGEASELSSVQPGEVVSCVAVSAPLNGLSGHDRTTMCCQQTTSHNA